jgi:hypothetical protein
MKEKEIAEWGCAGIIAVILFFIFSVIIGIII